MTPEGLFKAKLIREIKERYPGAVIIKNDASYLQGIPDHLILYGKTWAAFEAKRNINARIQPNQAYYVGLLDRMSLASFVYPENREDFLNELQRTFKFTRPTRLSRR